MHCVVPLLRSPGKPFQPWHYLVSLYCLFLSSLLLYTILLNLILLLALRLYGYLIVYFLPSMQFSSSLLHLFAFGIFISNRLDSIHHCYQCNSEGHDHKWLSSSFSAEKTNVHAMFIWHTHEVFDKMPSRDTLPTTSGNGFKIHSAGIILRLLKCLKSCPLEAHCQWLVEITLKFTQQVLFEGSFSFKSAQTMLIFVPMKCSKKFPLEAHCHWVLETECTGHVYFGIHEVFEKNSL